MDSTFWHKQTADKPPFPDLLWSRPENKAQAGKLLIIGGNAHGFAAPSEAYQEAEKTGAGTIRVALPDAIQKIVGGFFENAYFLSSTPSGSFSQHALDEMLELSTWSDAVLLTGDVGRNSETAILLEKFISKYQGQLAITKDALDYFLTTPKLLMQRPDTLLIATIEQLQKLAMHNHQTEAITLGMDLLKLVEALHQITSKFPAHIIVKHHQQLLVAVNGQISSTALKEDVDIWRVKTAAHATVWWLQNPAKPFEALSSSIF